MLKVISIRILAGHLWIVSIIIKILVLFYEISHSFLSVLSYYILFVILLILFSITAM